MTSKVMETPAMQGPAEAREIVGELLKNPPFMVSGVSGSLVHFPEVGRSEGKAFLIARYCQVRVNNGLLLQIWGGSMTVPFFSPFIRNSCV